MSMLISPLFFFSYYRIEKNSILDDRAKDKILTVSLSFPPVIILCMQIIHEEITKKRKRLEEEADEVTEKRAKREQILESEKEAVRLQHEIAEYVIMCVICYCL